MLEYEIIQLISIEQIAPKYPTNYNNVVNGSIISPASLTEVSDDHHVIPCSNVSDRLRISISPITIVPTIR